jgi:hypothetical protein
VGAVADGDQEVVGSDDLVQVGGSGLNSPLHQKLHEVPGHMDHRDDTSQPLEVQYGPAHEVTLEEGGILRGLAGDERIQVLHNGASTGSAARWQSRRGRPRGVEAFGYATRGALRWPCSGTRNGKYEQPVFAGAVAALARAASAQTSERRSRGQ